MSATGLDVFDKTLQTTNTWLKEIMDEIGPDRQVAWHVLGQCSTPCEIACLFISPHISALSYRCWFAASTMTNGSPPMCR